MGSPKKPKQKSEDVEDDGGLWEEEDFDEDDDEDSYDEEDYEDDF